MWAFAPESFLEGARDLEAITRRVTDSLARHGFDRPVDPNRLQWSRWFRCESTHSLLVVPSKPGIFALAEEIMDLGASTAQVGTTALGFATEQSPAPAPATSIVARSKDGQSSDGRKTDAQPKDREGHDFSHALSPARNSPALTAAGIADGTRTTDARRMLAVLQFSEDDDMAFTLDRMFTCVNPMRARLASGRCFLRFVAIQDQIQRRNICNALNQWMLSSAEKATGIPTDFSSSLELSSVGRAPLPAPADNAAAGAQGFQSGPEANVPHAAPHLDSGAAKNLHCPHSLPSGF
jgi:hypothetical protein